MTRRQLRELLADDIHAAAKALLGWRLRFGELEAQLVEVEAYCGYEDPGSHAFRGPTPRTRVMFGPTGIAYVYFTYGHHWMLNVSANPDGLAGAILIRAAIPLRGHDQFFTRREKAKSERDLLSGPGKICAAFGIDKSHYGLDLLSNQSPLQLLPGERIGDIVIGTRIGLSPGFGDDFPWRYVDSGAMEWVSKPHPKRD